jgi:hypothetical protein
MSSKVKPNNKSRKKKDTYRRRKIMYGVIAVVIVLAMLIAIFEALFIKNSIPVPSPEISISSIMTI